MALLRRVDPFREFLERFFEEDFPLPTRSGLATDVYETDKEVVVEMEVPGFEKKDIEISFQDGYLRVKGRVEARKEEKEKNYFRKEIKRESFARVIPILREVDTKKAKAFLNNGVLKISLPKVQREKESGGERILIE